MLDSDFNLKQDRGLKQQDSMQKAIQHKADMPFEQQAEKKMQVHEAAQRLNYAAFSEWMFDKGYTITKNR